MRCLSGCGRFPPLSLLPNNEVHIYARVQFEIGDLFDGGRGAVNVDDALVDAHLEPVPGLGALTTRGLPGGDLQGLGGHPDGSLDLEVLLLGALDQVGADLLQALDGAGGQGDADAVNHLVLGGAAFAILVAGLKRNTQVGQNMSILGA